MGSGDQRRGTAHARARLQLRHRADSPQRDAQRHHQLLMRRPTSMTLRTPTSLIARRTIFAVLTVAGAGGCELDTTNPNAATEQGVLTSAAGIRALAIGMQGRYGNTLEESIFIPGIISGELGNTNATQSTTREFQRFPIVTANTEIDVTNLELAEVWSKNFAVVKAANDIIGNIDN